jgi:hypothetical protein
MQKIILLILRKTILNWVSGLCREHQIIPTVVVTMSKSVICVHNIWMASYLLNSR